MLGGVAVVACRAMLVQGLILFGLAGLVHAQQCDVPGFCQGSVVGITTVESQVECLEFCQSIPTCEWFSYKPEDGACNAFSSCPSVNTDNCGDCVSGENECDACFVHGECFGFFLDLTEVRDVNDCLDACQHYPGCEWFTYFEESEICYFYSTCDVLEQACMDCVSGEDECLPLEGQGEILGENTWNL